MTTALTHTPAPMRKSPTGIAGFDQMTGGGLPTERTTLLLGGPGSQASAMGARRVVFDAGVTLADIYTAGGEVLMGTMRWEKESAERVAQEMAEVQGQLKRVQLDAEEAELEVRLRSLQTVLVAKQVEKELLNRTIETRERELKGGRTMMRELRGADAAINADPAP